MKNEYYNGWKIEYRPHDYQLWKAKRFGVGMCANTKESLKQMIDTKILIERERIKQLKG